MPSESLEQLMGSMENSDHVYLHQCYVRVLSHCSMDSVFAFFFSFYILYMLGLSSFQVVSIQFGTDQLQLQGAPSDHLSAFVFWYLTIELLLAALFSGYFICFLSLKIKILPKNSSCVEPSQCTFDFSHSEY